MKRISLARIKILSVIENLDASGVPDGESERDESEREGYYSFSDGEIEITYSDESEAGRAESVIAVNGETVKVKRTGSISSELIFEEGKSHSSLYSVPPYSFDATVRTKRIRRALDESGGRLDLYYNMSIGGADKSARMSIWIYPVSDHS